MSLDLRVTPHQSAFMANRAQTVYALVDLQPAGVDGRLPLDLRLVIDHSGSMSLYARSGSQQSKLELLKQAVAGMIDELAVGDRLMLVAFDHDAQTLFDGVITDQLARDRAKKKLRGLAEGGGTAMHRGLELALGEAPLPDRVARVVVVTDGETDGQEECTRMAFDARGQMGWLVYGIGIDYDDQFLDGLARANGGQFVHLSDLAAAAEAFSREVGVMGEVVLTNLVVSVEPAPGVEVVKADRIVPQILPVTVADPRFLSVDLGDVDRARGQKLLLQLSVSAMPAGSQTLATIRAGYHVPVRKLLNQTTETTLVVAVTNDERAIAVDGDVTRTVQLAGANRLYTLGVAEAASGDAGKSAFTLASAAAVFEALGKDELSTKMRTLSSTLTTRGSLDGDGEDVKRTLTTMARQAWEDGDGPL